MNTMLTTVQYLGIALQAASGAFSSGLYAGLPSTNTVLRACFTTSMMLSTCHSVMNSHFMGHTDASCQLTSVDSSTSLTTSESPMRIRNNSMGSRLKSSV